MSVNQKLLLRDSKSDKHNIRPEFCDPIKHDILILHISVFITEDSKIRVFCSKLARKRGYHFLFCTEQEDSLSLPYCFFQKDLRDLHTGNAFCHVVSQHMRSLHRTDTVGHDTCFLIHQKPVELTVLLSGHQRLRVRGHHKKALLFLEMF